MSGHWCSYCPGFHEPDPQWACPRCGKQFKPSVIAFMFHLEVCMATQQVRNGKKVESGRNAREWKNMTPRYRTGPFLRIRDKEGNFVR